MQAQGGTGVGGVEIGTAVLQHHHDDLSAQLVAHVHDRLLALHRLHALAGADEMGLRVKLWVDGNSGE